MIMCDWMCGWEPRSLETCMNPGMCPVASAGTFRGATQLPCAEGCTDTMCVGVGAGEARRVAHVTHTPARRLFRALLATPPDEAGALVPVILAALRRRAVGEWWEDVTHAFFWWSNLQMLRLFLVQLEEGTVMAVGDWSWLRPAMDEGLLVRPPPRVLVRPQPRCCCHLWTLMHGLGR